jgi:mRNA interferase HigB
MHVITRKALVDFWTRHPDSREALARWHKIVEKSSYQSFAELRLTFPSADMVGQYTVFNIGGNKYRLIASIHYDRGRVYIRHVLTHEEYNRGLWKK